MLLAFMHHPMPSHAPSTSSTCYNLLFNFLIFLWSMSNLNGIISLTVASEHNGNVSSLTQSSTYNEYGNVNEQFAIPPSPRIICEDDQNSMSFTCPKKTHHSTKTQTTTKATTKSTTTLTTTTTTSTTTRPKVTKSTEKKHLSVVTVALPRKTSLTPKSTTSTQSYLNKMFGKMKLGSVTESILMKKSFDTVQSHDHGFVGVFNNEVNNVLVVKDNLIKKLLPTGQIFCTFDEELHIKNSDPICRKPEWKVGDNEASISVEYHGKHSRHKRSIVGQKEPLTLEERRQLERLYGNQFNLEAAETVKAMGMAENGHWIPSSELLRNQNIRRERRFLPSRWSLDNNKNSRQINSPISIYQDEEQLHQAEQEEVDERHLELEQGTYPLSNNNERYWTQTKYNNPSRPANNNHQKKDSSSSNNNNNNIILESKSKPELEALLKSVLEKLQETKNQVNIIDHDKELLSSKQKNMNVNNSPTRKIRHLSPSSNNLETQAEEEEKDAEEECSLYGTWLSPLAGVAMTLHPIGQTVTVTLENLPGITNPLVSKSWMGTAMISPVSPTTLVLLFQEGQLTLKQSIEESPETAIFVGQCIYCSRGGTAIQGSWTIFTRKRNCLPPSITNNKNMTEHYANSELLYRKSL